MKEFLPTDIILQAYSLFSDNIINSLNFHEKEYFIMHLASLVNDSNQSLQQYPSFWSILIHFFSTNVHNSRLYEIVDGFNSSFFNISIPPVQNIVQLIFKSSDLMDISSEIIGFAPLVIHFPIDVTNGYIMRIFKLISCYFRNNKPLDPSIELFLIEFWKRFKDHPKGLVFQRFFKIVDDSTFYISSLLSPSITPSRQSTLKKISPYALVSGLTILSHRLAGEPLPTFVEILSSLLLEDMIVGAYEPLCILFENRNNDPSPFLFLFQKLFSTLSDEVIQESVIVLRTIFVNSNEELQAEISSLCLSFINDNEINMQRRSFALECLTNFEAGFEFCQSAISSDEISSFPNVGKFIRRNFQYADGILLCNLYSKLIEILMSSGAIIKRGIIEMSRAAIEIFLFTQNLEKPINVLLKLFNDYSLQEESILLANRLLCQLTNDESVNLILLYRNFALQTSNRSFLLHFFDFVSEISEQGLSSNLVILQIAHDLFTNSFEYFQPMFFSSDNLFPSIFRFLSSCIDESITCTLVHWLLHSSDFRSIDVAITLRHFTGDANLYTNIVIEKYRNTQNRTLVSELIWLMLSWNLDVDYSNVLLKIHDYWDDDGFFISPFLAVLRKNTALISNEKKLVFDTAVFLKMNLPSIYTLDDLLAISEYIPFEDDLQLYMSDVFILCAVNDDYNEIAGKCIDRLEKMVKNNNAILPHISSEEGFGELESVLPNLFVD